MGKKVIILGTAHLRTTPGKCSPDKRFREYAYSREIVSMVELELMKRGYTVYVDYRETDPNGAMKASTPRMEQSRELAYRVTRVNKLCAQFGTKNCVYISIHNNAAGSGGQWRNATGFSVLVSLNSSSNSKRLAQIFTDEAKKKGLSGNRSIPKERYWSKNLYVLKNTYCPAVLTENLFQDNKGEVDFMLTDVGKQTITALHVDAIERYCNE
jgi:N-acetylmuramoyl-L-alanine amidase